MSDKTVECENGHESPIEQAIDGLGIAACPECGVTIEPEQLMDEIPSGEKSMDESPRRADDDIVLTEEDIERMKEDGYIFVDTPTGFYSVTSSDYFDAWLNGEARGVPETPREDDYVSKK